MSKITYEDKESLNVDSTIPEKNKVTDQNMNDIKNSVNALYDGEIFSTSETLTNKKWIDGKPIYKKVIVASGPFTSNTPTIDISSLGAENVMVDFTHTYWRFDDPDNNYSGQFDTPSCSLGATTMRNVAIAITDINYDSNELELYLGNNNLNDSTLTLYITLEYTKTTD